MINHSVKNIPQGWKETTLGEVADDGFFSIYNNKRLPLSSDVRLKMQGQFPYYGAASAIDFINDYKFDGYYLLIAEDGTVTSNGISPMLQLVDGKFWVSNHSHVLQSQDRQLTKFLFYVLKNVNINQYITGAVQPKLSKENLLRIQVLFPNSENEQRGITAVLSAFDDKIELLHKQNKILENSVQGIFKRWFMKFEFPNKTGKPYKSNGGQIADSDLGEIPEGWRVGKLTEIFDFMEGPGIRNWQYTESGRRFINIRLIQDGDINIKDSSFISEEEAEATYKHFHMQEKDMVVSTSGTLGRSAIVRKEHLPLMLNTSVIRFRPIDKMSYGFMYQFLNSRFFQNELESLASGSVQLNFGPVHLKQIEMVIPPDDVLKMFAQAANPLYKKITFTLSQIETLSALRDCLLPKLMRGEIRVKGF